MKSMIFALLFQTDYAVCCVRIHLARAGFEQLYDIRLG